MSKNNQKLYRNYNKLYIINKYNRFIHNDENNNFKMNIIHFEKEDNYEIYWVINELYAHSETNVLYYQKNIHDQQFYHEDNLFIIKRKKIFEKIQKFNLAIFKLKHILKIRYMKSKNHNNLFGENFKSNHIELIENGSKFKFDYFEIYNIVDSCFKQTCDEMPIIVNIKNPYTNQSFGFNNIVNIYFLLMNNGRIPKYFYLYFLNNLSKEKIYDKYHFHLFIDIMKYKYTHFNPEIKIKYIDKMLEYYHYHLFVRKSIAFKIKYLSNIGFLFFLAVKVINHYGDEYYHVYAKYIDECKSNLKTFRLTVAVHSRFTINTY